MFEPSHGAVRSALRSRARSGLRLAAAGLLAGIYLCAAGCGPSRFAGPEVQKLSEEKRYYQRKKPRQLYDVAWQTCLALAMTNLRPSAYGDTLLIGGNLPRGRAGLGGETVNIKIIKAASGRGALLQLQLFVLDPAPKRAWTARFFAEFHQKLGVRERTAEEEEARERAAEEGRP